MLVLVDAAVVSRKLVVRVRVEDVVLAVVLVLLDVLEYVLSVVLLLVLVLALVDVVAIVLLVVVELVDDSAPIVGEFELVAVDVGSSVVQSPASNPSQSPPSKLNSAQK